ncbi:MAG: glycosyltransferase family 4 protein [Alphaproteobacteria bacterium]
MINVLSFTSLYPNAAQPVHGVFVENRLRRLLETGEVKITVVAPVPWFPFKSALFGRYSDFARVPAHEVRHGIDIFHPRYKVVPKVGMSIAPSLMFRGVRDEVIRLKRLLQIDLIDAHYFYPDGVAAVRLAQDLAVPVCVTARGSDLTEIPAFPKPRQQIAQAAGDADAIVTVCDALQRPLVDLGIDRAKIRTLRNGVDLDLFQPVGRDIARAKWGVTGKTVLSVGLLIDRKGHNLTIEAMQHIPNTTLLIAGSGETRGELEAQIKSLGLTDRVRLLGQVPHEDLPSLYSAADAMVLASSREGWANVLLEAMACGTPVVATDIWGTPEVVAAPEAGVLIKERSPEAIIKGIEQLFAALPDRAATRAYAEKFSWNETTQGVLQLFRDLTAGQSR